jgi:holo-[acyl-carrier protein] synthase
MTRVGIDLVSLAAIDDAVATQGERWLDRVFTDAELAAARRSGALQTAVLAEGFAAKEAAIKALRPERADAVAWRDVELEADRRSLLLRGGALELARAGGIAGLVVSVSRVEGYASAVVVAHAAQGELA